MNKIVLNGCSPVPLAGYLKSLGILRLLSDHDPNLRGYWQGEHFALSTMLEQEQITTFFLESYEPTPIIAPWNGGSGFYFQERKSAEKDPETGKKIKLGIFDQATSATKAVSSILDSSNSRFENLRAAINVAKKLIGRKKLITAPEAGPNKDSFIVELRGLLPDACIRVMDAGMAIVNMQWQASPLVGSGWNDGNLDFTNNFMQRLTETISLDGKDIPKGSEAWLQSALFGSAAPNQVNKAIGQFSPGQAGGPNGSTGFEANAAINPWDFILMIEGALLFAAATARRNASGPGALSYPFTVRAVGAGAGSLGEGDLGDARGELWMPLWDQPAALAEIRALMAEGRVSLGRKPARDALDFVRAVHQLGGYRGVRSFQRFGLLMRSGRAFLATPLARVEISGTPQTNLLDELDHNGWLDRFRGFSRTEHVPARFKTLRRRLEDRLFDLAGRQPTPADMQSLLALLGAIQNALASSSSARDKVRPVPRLSEQWVQKADDGLPAFRITAALAGLHGVADEPLPIRAQLFPLHRQYDRWITPETSGGRRILTGQKGSLGDTLHALLAHRLQLIERLQISDKPLAGSAGATMDDVATFLQSNAMDHRIADLLPGLSLCRIPRDTDHGGGDGVLPAAFSLMKLALTPDRTLRAVEIKRRPLLASNEHVPVPTGMVAQLGAGNADRAAAIAWRRLRSSGLPPLFANPDALPGLPAAQTRRAAAALLIPLRFGATATLARTVLRDPETEVAFTNQ
jgi:CRISPR-associated protein Csx17